MALSPHSHTYTVVAAAVVQTAKYCSALHPQSAAALYPSRTLDGGGQRPFKFTGLVVVAPGEACLTQQDKVCVVGLYASPVQIRSVL